MQPYIPSNFLLSYRTSAKNWRGYCCCWADMREFRDRLFLATSEFVHQGKSWRLFWRLFQIIKPFFKLSYVWTCLDLYSKFSQQRHMCHWIPIDKKLSSVPPPTFTTAVFTEIHRIIHYKSIFLIFILNNDILRCNFERPRALLFDCIAEKTPPYWQIQSN